MGFDKGIFAVFNWIFFINRSWLIKKQRDELCKFELFLIIILRFIVFLR